MQQLTNNSEALESFPFYNAPARYMFPKNKQSLLHTIKAWSI